MKNILIVSGTRPEIIKLAPLYHALRGARHQGLELAVLLDIAAHQIHAQRPRQRFDKAAGFVVEAGHHQFGAHLVRQLGAAPGNAVFVGQAQDQAFFAGQAECVVVFCHGCSVEGAGKRRLARQCPASARKIGRAHV